MHKEQNEWDGTERRECAVHRMAFDGFNKALEELKACVAEIKRGVTAFVSWKLFIWIVGGLAGIGMVLLMVVYQDHMRVSNKVQDNTFVIGGMNVKMDIMLDNQRRIDNKLEKIINGNIK